MKRHSLIRQAVPALVVAATLLNGCSWFHHRDRVDYYKGAAETRPLEVPPDLDAPQSSSKELVVPGDTAASAGATATGVQSASTTPPALPDANELHVGDTVANTWQRVGVELERGQFGKVTGRDEATHSYTLEFNGAVTDEAAVAPEHHWYTRVLHPFGGNGAAKSHVVTSVLHVNVSEDKGGSRVEAIGDAVDKSAGDAARRVIQGLREHLS